MTRYTVPSTVRKTFDTDYAPVTSDPKFGDAVLLVNQSNVLVHSATYLAADVVFTKNGGILTQPWTYMKLADLVSYHAARPAAQGDHLPEENVGGIV